MERYAAKLNFSGILAFVILPFFFVAFALATAGLVASAAKCLMARSLSLAPLPFGDASDNGSATVLRSMEITDPLHWSQPAGVRG
ncbi:hypothetical protein D3C77_711490 [compost metagenome]